MQAILNIFRITSSSNFGNKIVTEFSIVESFLNSLIVRNNHSVECIHAALDIALWLQDLGKFSFKNWFSQVNPQALDLLLNVVDYRIPFESSNTLNHITHALQDCLQLQKLANKVIF